PGTYWNPALLEPARCGGTLRSSRLVVRAGFFLQSGLQGGFHAVPTAHYTGINVEQVKDTTQAVFNDVVNALGPIIKGRHRRGDNRAHFSYLGHSPDMAEMQRGLPQHEHKPAPFLQDHVGRPADQPGCNPLSDLSQ